MRMGDGPEWDGGGQRGTRNRSQRGRRKLLDVMGTFLFWIRELVP